MKERGTLPPIPPSPWPWLCGCPLIGQHSHVLYKDSLFHSPRTLPMVMCPLLLLPFVWVHFGPEHLVLNPGNTTFIVLSILEERSGYRYPTMLPQEFLKLVSSRDLGKSIIKADFDFKPRLAVCMNS